MTADERIAAAFLASPEALRGILAKWNELDPDLREHYTSETEWFFALVQRRLPSRQDDLRRAREEIVAMGDAIEQAMGFRPEDIFNVQT